MTTAAATRQSMAAPGDECDLSGEFDARCRISVHYASTPAMDNNGKREDIRNEVAKEKERDRTT